MKKLPFGLTPDTGFFCPLSTHQEALNVLNFALASGEALVKVVGEVGTGKTLLCRLLLNQLETNQRKVAYIPYPKMSARELKFALAKELGLRIQDTCRDDQLGQRIQSRLLNLNKKHGPVVLLIDEAQQLDAEGIETLRLFTNIETEQQKLLQIVLFGQPELDTLLAKPSMRQIKQRIVFSYRLKSLDRQQISDYVTSRLTKATAKPIAYSWFANYMISRYSKGIPRLVNVLCHKSLLLSFGQNKEAITARNIMRAAKDTESITTWCQDNIRWLLSIIALLTSGSAMAWLGL